MKCELKKINGNKVIEINGVPYSPMAFRSFRPTPANVSLFYRNGVRLFQMICSGVINCLGIKYSAYGEIWKGDNEYDFTAFDKQMEMFQKFAPEGYYCIMIQLDTPDWFIKKHNIPDSFRKFGIACFYDEWKSAAKEYLKAFIRYAEEHYGDRIFAYSFSSGLATEWFTDDKGAYDLKKEEYFKKYMNDEKVKIPTAEELNRFDGDFLYPKASDIPAYYKFTAEKTADTICEYAAAAQSVIEHKKLIGLFYGYMDLASDLQNRWGTAEYEKVWKSEDIDMIFSPAAYREARKTENPAAYQVAVDSIELNGKMYLHEIDHRTHLAKYPLENGAIIEDGYDSEEETVMVLRREMCQAVQKGSALWWFDFTGGYFFSPRYESEIKRAVEILNMLKLTPRKPVSEVAVFYDSESCFYLNDNMGIKEDYVTKQILEIAKSGVLYDIYNLNDIGKIDTTRYKMFIFLNAFKISEKTLEVIYSSDAYKVWIHAPMYANAREISDIEKAVGMKLRRVEGVDKIVCGGAEYGFSKDMSLMLAPEGDIEILGSYKGTDIAAVAKKGKNIYSGAANIPYTVWKNFERIAGVHIYTENGTGIYGDSRFLCYQNPFSDECEIKLTEDCKFEELFDGGEYESTGKVLKYGVPKGTTKMFLRK